MTHSLETTTSDRLSRSSTSIVLLFILALGAVLRLIHLGSQSFWWDEVYSATLSAQSLRTVVPRFGQTPALYHTLLHFWLYLGHGDATIRLLSVLFGIVTLWVVYLLGKDLLNSQQGRLGAFILAISPFHLWYSQEARMYSLLILLCTISVLFFIRFLRNRPGWPSLWWILTTVLAMYTHYYAAFVLCFQLIFLVLYWRRYRSRWPQAVRALLAMGLLVVPIFLLLFAAGRYEMVCAEGAGRNPLKPLSIPYTFFVFSLGFSYGPAVADLHRLASPATLRPYVLHLVPAMLLFLALFIMGLRSLWTKRELFVFLLLYMFVPIAGACFTVLFLSQISYNVRYVSMILPAYGLIIARGILFPKRKLIRWGLLLLVSLFVAVSIRNYYVEEKYHKENYHLAAQIITRGTEKGDVILTTHLKPLQYYYQGNLSIHNLLWSPTFYRRMIDVRLRSYRRAWVLMGRSWVSDPEGQMLDYLRSTHSVVSETTFTNLYLGLFDLRAARNR